MSDLSVLNIAQKIEESTDRIVDALDRLTVAIINQTCYADVDEETVELAYNMLNSMKEKYNSGR